MATSSAPLIAWAHLGEILLASLVGGIGVVALVSLGIVCWTAGQRPNRQPATRALLASGALVCAVVCLGIVGWAFYLVIHKS